MKRTAGWVLALSMLSTSMLSTSALAKSDHPNILVIWGDDIGWQNVSAYGRGTMGYSTPNNIDSIGLKAASPSLAEVMKAQGYSTGHFGKVGKPSRAPVR